MPQPPLQGCKAPPSLGLQGSSVARREPRCPSPPVTGRGQRSRPYLRGYTALLVLQAGKAPAGCALQTFLGKVSSMFAPLVKYGQFFPLQRMLHELEKHARENTAPGELPQHRALRRETLQRGYLQDLISEPPAPRKAPRLPRPAAAAPGSAAPHSAGPRAGRSLRRAGPRAGGNSGRAVPRSGGAGRRGAYLRAEGPLRWTAGRGRQRAREPPPLGAAPDSAPLPAPPGAPRAEGSRRLPGGRGRRKPQGREQPGWREVAPGAAGALRDAVPLLPARSARHGAALPPDARDGAGQAALASAPSFPPLR